MDINKIEVSTRHPLKGLTIVTLASFVTLPILFSQMDVSLFSIISTCIMLFVVVIAVGIKAIKQSIELSPEKIRINLITGTQEFSVEQGSKPEISQENGLWLLTTMDSKVSKNLHVGAFPSLKDDIDAYYSKIV